MREIKFRGLRVNGNDWTFGQIYKHEPPLVCFGGDRENPKYFILSTGSADWNMPRPINQHEVFEDSVGQCTGVQDKDEVDIYEGDILEVFGSKSPNIFTVVWGDGSVKYNFRLGFVLIRIDNTVQWDLTDRITCKVIGNIYENEY